MNRPARLSKRLTPQQHRALAEALRVPEDEINPTDALQAIFDARDRGLDDLEALQKAVDILMDAGIVVKAGRP